MRLKTVLGWTFGTLRRRPRYLGLVSTSEHEPLGHCVRVARGYWVTSSSTVAGRAKHEMEIEDLKRRRGIPCEVHIDDQADLAILRIPEPPRLARLMVAMAATDRVESRTGPNPAISEPLGRPVAAVAATDGVAPGTEVVITCLPRSKPWYRSSYVDVTGTWRGGTTRDGVLRLGRQFDANEFAPIRGAPVRRRDDNVVVGIVSAARAEPEDGSTPVWLSRTEDLRAFADGITELNFVSPSRADIPSVAVALNILAAALILPVSDYLERESGRSIRWSGLAVVALATFFLSIIGYVQLRRSLPLFRRIWWLRPFHPYVFDLVPAVVTLAFIWFGTQFVSSMAPRPVTLYVLDQTEAALSDRG